jgi:hypothetical protein
LNCLFLDTARELEPSQICFKQATSGEFHDHNVSVSLFAGKY